MAPEYAILKASKIYRLSSTPEGARRLTLHRMRSSLGCGNALIVTAYTLGIVPVTLPAVRFFEYELETDGTVEEVEHPLCLYERFSIWEWPLKWRWNEKTVTARALAYSIMKRTKEG
jgi:hypothetical protein